MFLGTPHLPQLRLMLGLGVAGCQDQFWHPDLTDTSPPHAEKTFKITLYKWLGKTILFWGKGEIISSLHCITTQHHGYNEV